MAKVDKQSLRDEFASLKGQFKHLSAKEGMSTETRALIRTMIMLFEVILAVFMEKNTRKNSKNSSIPSSQTGKDETSSDQSGRKGANGKGKAQNDMQADNIRTDEKEKLSRVRDCDNCGEDLSKVTVSSYEKRTIIDILFVKEIRHVKAEIKRCFNCGATVKGRFPANMPGPLQYGFGIKAFALNLLIAQMMSLNRIQKTIKALLGNAIAEATILKYVLQLNDILEPWEQKAKSRLLASPALHADETSLRVDKKNNWIHVCSSGDITLKILHPRRGKEAIEDIGIIPNYTGVVVHDCWASYLSYDHCGHALCGSHLLRELTFVQDSNGYSWARNMKRLLQKACAMVAKSKKKKLTAAKYAQLQKNYRNILTRGDKELPPIPPRQDGKRGRIAKSDAHNLWERMKRYEEAILLFAKLAHVAFTNNRAERDLRMSKVKQKVSGCFRAPVYAKAYCRISSYLQTMENLGYNPLVAINLAFSGKIYNDWGE